MPKLTSEAVFEAAIEETLLERQHFFRAKPEDYDRQAGLIPATVIRFLQVTQPEKWASYKDVVGEGAEKKALARIEEILTRHGTLYLFRKGFDESGHHFDMCFFKPASGLNPETQKLYAANVFQVARQVKYSTANENSVDTVIFLNGLPIFTMELKNPPTLQNFQHAIRQYKFDRDPKEPLFRFARCFAHFAVDPSLVYMTSALAGRDTSFLPFNQGHDQGAGNPPSKTGFSTAYLWEEIWQKDSILDLIQRFIQVVDVLDDKGRKTGKKKQIFPRYHQLDTVRRLTADAKVNGSGQSYLNQHSAGSGKTIEIATLAASLATLHGMDDKAVFTSVIVVSDARVIDRMLQRTLAQFVSTPGMLENINKTSRQLKEALVDGKKIIVSTIQKYPHVLQQMEELPEARFAVIIDEAHSSQAGKTAGAINQVLSYSKATEEREEEAETWEDEVVALMKSRKRMKHVSFFAFTATPKPETLELFGTRQRPGGPKVPFTQYTMRQAIEEGFILDVLKNYTTYNQYWHLLQKAQEDPEVDKRKALRLLKHFVGDNRHPIARKARLMVDHFMEHVQKKCQGTAKAMIVARNRLSAVRYALEVRAYLVELGNPFQALVAFTDTVKNPDNGGEYTEANMNAPEKDTEDAFKKAENRFLIVANKFQTGFDQPLLTAMYVDRRLKGVTAVQTLSRLNRTADDKGKKDQDVFVLDFENTAENIKLAFQIFYDRIELVADTKPSTLYDIRNDLAEYALYRPEQVGEFCSIQFSRLRDTQKRAKMEALVSPLCTAFKEMPKDDRRDYRSKMRDYVKLYAYLSQILPFSDKELEKLYHFSAFLVNVLPGEKDETPKEILELVSMDNFKPELISDEPIVLQRQVAEVMPKNWGQGVLPEQAEKERLSKIIEDLNQRFGTHFTPEDRVVIQNLEQQIEADEILAQQIKAGSRDAVRLSFEQVAQDLLHGLIESNFRFYKKVQDDREIAHELFDRLFERYYERKKT
jgi:type I restriction enzyme R subunit